MPYLRPDAYGHQSPIAEVRIGCAAPRPGMRRCWSEDEWKYVLYGRADEDTSYTKLFSSVLLTPVQSGYGRYMDPLYIGLTDPTDERDWLEWLVDLFAPEQLLHALDRAVEEKERAIDIWITLPYPDRMQLDFGLAAGKSLNFRYPEDRLHALIWWMERCLNKWQQASFAHPLKLRGFHWPREVLVVEDEGIVRAVSQHVRAAGLRFMWLAQYGSSHVHAAREKGFDLTYVHPGYYGRTDIPVDYIDYTAVFTSVLECGLQVACGKGLLFDRQHPYEYWRRGLPSRQGYLDRASLMFVFQETDLVELARSRKPLYRDLVHVVQGIDKRRSRLEGSKLRMR